MQLDSKIDKQLCRYLKKVSFKVDIATTNESRHYYLKYDEGDCDVRFSAHYATRASASNLSINIIKCTESLYRVHVGNLLQVMVEAEGLLSYIKSMCTVLPEVTGVVTITQKMAKKLKSTHDTLKTKFAQEVAKVKRKYAKLEDLTYFENLNMQIDYLSASVAKGRIALGEAQASNGRLKKEKNILVAQNNILTDKLKAINRIINK